MTLLERPILFALRVSRAWRFYRCLHCSWRLAWVKASYYDGSLA